MRPDVTVDEALGYLRRQARARVETIYYAYVLDERQRLLGVLSFRELFAAPPGTRVRELMRTGFTAVRVDTDVEEVAQTFTRTGLLAIPVVGDGGVMQGIVTVDDIVHVVQDSATEDVQKLGGSEALDMPYLQIGFWSLVSKRAGWLADLRAGLAPHRGRGVPRRRRQRHLGHPRRRDAAVPAAAGGARPGERVGAVRGDVGRCHRPDHLLQPRRVDPARLVGHALPPSHATP